MPAYFGSLILILLITARESHFQLLVPAAVLAKGLFKWLTCGVPIDFSTINSINSPLINAGVCWSLRLEWFFYLALALLAWFATKKRDVVLWLLCAGIAATSV